MMDVGFAYIYIYKIHAKEKRNLSSFINVTHYFIITPKVLPYILLILFFISYSIFISRTDKIYHVKVFYIKNKIFSNKDNYVYNISLRNISISKKIIFDRLFIKNPVSTIQFPMGHIQWKFKLSVWLIWNSHRWSITRGRSHWSD